MSKQEVVYISIIMQLVNEGNPDLSKINPNIKEFIDGCMEEYRKNPENEASKALYHFADSYFNTDKEKMH